MEKFVKRIYLEGVVGKCIFNFGKNGLEIQMKNSSNTIGIVGTIKKESFEDYKEIGELTLANIDTLANMFSFFSDDMEIIPEYNDDKKEVVRVMFKATNNEYSHMVSLADSVEKHDLINSIKNIEFDEEFETELDLFKTALKQQSILDADGMKIEIDKDVISCLMGENNISRTKGKLETPLKNVYSLKFGVYIIKVMKALETKTKIKISQNPDMPLIIENNEDGVEFKYVLMPTD